MKIITKFYVQGYFEDSLIMNQLAFGKKDLNEVVNYYIRDTDIDEIRIKKLGYASENDIKIHNL